MSYEEEDTCMRSRDGLMYTSACAIVCLSLCLSLCVRALAFFITDYQSSNPWNLNSTLNPRPSTLDPIRSYYVQALQRGKNDRKPKGDNSPPAAEGGGFGMFSMFQRCMTGENDLPPARD